jgi:hypothetical protein
MGTLKSASAGHASVTKWTREPREAAKDKKLVVSILAYLNKMLFLQKSPGFFLYL